MVNTLVQNLGSVDILINNAGIAQFGTLLDMETEQWGAHYSNEPHGNLLCNPRCTACND